MKLLIGGSPCTNMKIGLIDVDGHNFPNLALMKLSAWHKVLGDTVEWWWGFGSYDRVYMSNIQTDEDAEKNETATVEM